MAEKTTIQVVRLNSAKRPITISHATLEGAIQNALRMWDTGEGDTSLILRIGKNGHRLNERQIREHASRNGIGAGGRWIDMPENFIRKGVAYVGGQPERPLR